MSASLVGSEMCIRDRPPHLLGFTWRRVPDALRRAAGPSIRIWVRPSLPVSYTHLTLPTICSV
eukprot:973939-Alexandrium_andersonii.AAC.1